MTYSDNDILNVIISSKVSKGMKKEVIKHHINISNVVKVISSTQLYSASDLIYELNPEIIDKYIESLDKEGIIEYYNSVWKTDKLSYEIFKRKNDLLVKIIKNTSEEDLIDLIKKIRYSKFTTLLFKLRREDMHNAIMKLNDPYDIMFILNHDNISNKDKMELINNKREKILSKIKNLRQHDYIAYMRSNLLPDEVKKMMMDECYDNIVECINKIDEESLKLYILSDDFYEPFNELIIKLRVDEVNIISLLKAKYTDNKILEKIIILKNQTLRNMIQKLSLKELMYFKSYILTEDIRNIIIKNNIDIVENLIKKENYSKESIYEFITSKDVPSEIKKAFLRYLKMHDEDLENIIDFYKAKNTILVIDKYTCIKEFINSLNINFDSFIQYGIGSIKYKNWLNQILDILSLKKENEFLEVYKYFLSEYYTDNKGNNVYIINNFLEILDIYSRYPSLCNYLKDNAIKLMEEDKKDLKFLFRIKYDKDIKTLDEVKGKRKSIYELYAGFINNDKCYKLPIHDIKKIYYELLFSYSNEEIKK